MHHTSLSIGFLCCISIYSLLPDEDKEEDEGDDGEGEHHDPPEQPGARLAAVHAVATGEV